MASAEDEVRDLFGRQAEAMRAKDIDRLMAMYAPDVVYFDVVPPLRFAGPAALRDRFTRWFDSWESALAIEVRDLRVVVRGTSRSRTGSAGPAGPCGAAGRPAPGCG
ncbi:YybH family protein [Phytohabitans houttuyneae]|uniref:SnoaL-like domain-containing protein n=1 Tax=Phytohabitans houttuyneae TaxID=1076126 RepID=A0A6V8KGI3_9ACTN|nr:nuclear transport factor 2 family protein [Phytohabitans houttuyneae]GFJ82924.1 hypothetical protein Phou_071040 [Phytohabitans houttuyneae]